MLPCGTPDWTEYKSVYFDCNLDKEISVTKIKFNN